MIQTIEGNMLEDIEPYTVLLHQVNCIGKFGQGVSAAISKKFDGFWQSYSSYCKWFQPDYNGKSHIDEILGTWHRFEAKPDLIVCSAFGIAAPSRDGASADIDAWSKILRKLALQTRRANKALPEEKQWKIRMPYKLGMNLDDMSWEELNALIEQNFKDSPDLFAVYDRSR